MDKRFSDANLVKQLFEECVRNDFEGFETHEKLFGVPEMKLIMELKPIYDKNGELTGWNLREF